MYLSICFECIYNCFFDIYRILHILVLCIYSIIYFMTKSLSLWLLSLVMIFFISLLLQSDTNALSVQGIVSFRVDPDVSTCLYWTSVNLWSHTGQYESYILTSSFVPSIFSCTDYEGLSAWSMTLAANDLSNGLQIIPKENVYLVADTNQVIEGQCKTGSNASVPISIWSSAWIILSKQGSIGQICKISADNVQVSVQIPANQAIWIYSWVLNLNVPWSN